MGVAAYNRTSKVIRQQLSNTRPIEFEKMDQLNAIPKRPDAGHIFSNEVKIGVGHRGWWIYCPVTGFGFWYKTLNEAMSRWHIEIVGFDGDWIAQRKYEF